MQTIEWTRPTLAEEEREFRHPAKLDFYSSHGIDWERIVASFDRGSLVPYPRGETVAEVPVRLSYHSYDDYLAYVVRAKRSYRQNYTRMERDLERQGRLVLPAPIVIRSEGEGLLFSGYRRLCLAWNRGMLPSVWLFDVAASPAGGKETESPR